MAKTVAGKISGVLNRKSFFQLWLSCIKLKGPVKNVLLISKDMSFIIKMKFILIISKEKSKTVAGKDSGVSDRMSDLRFWMCIAWNW
jgi:hypothetical protein